MDARAEHSTLYRKPWLNGVRLAKWLCFLGRAEIARRVKNWGVISNLLSACFSRARTAFHSTGRLRSQSRERDLNYVHNLRRHNTSEATVVLNSRKIIHHNTANVFRAVATMLWFAGGARTANVSGDGERAKWGIYEAESFNKLGKYRNGLWLHLGESQRNALNS